MDISLLFEHKFLEFINIIDYNNNINTLNIYNMNKEICKSKSKNNKYNIINGFKLNIIEENTKIYFNSDETPIKLDKKCDTYDKVKYEYINNKDNEKMHIA